MLKQQKPCQSFTEILLRFQCSLNLNEVLDKIWAEVMALTVRNCIRIDIGFRSSRVWDIELIKNILTVMKEMKRFLDREITFPINVIFKKWKTILSIKLGIQDTVDISSLIIILSNNRLLRFLSLARQEISDYVTQKEDMKYWIDFHKCGKFKLNYQRVSFKDMLNQKKNQHINHLISLWNKQCWNCEHLIKLDFLQNIWNINDKID